VSKKQTAGFTVLEVAVAGAFFAVILGAAAVGIAQDNTTARVILAPLSPELRAQDALHRIASELRMAGEYGEDVNHNGELDEGEDTNDNGVLDSNWNLDDLTTNQGSLAFNRRIDMRDETGAITASGVYSRRVRYFLNDEKLIREWWRTDENGNIVVRRVTMAHGVAGLRFSRTGRLVTISLDALIDNRPYGITRRTVATQITLRN